MKDITNIIHTLHAANMKILDKKSKFFQRQTEFLGHIIKNGRITVDPGKIEACMVLLVILLFTPIINP